MKELQLFYKKYTEMIFSVLFLMGAVIILFQVIIPAWAAAQESMTELSFQQKSLEEYKASTQTLSSLNNSLLSSQVEDATRALPSSKEVQSIYLAITTSTTKAGVSLAGFTVQVGDIFQKGGVKKVDIGVPSVTVKLHLSDVDIQSLSSFLTALSQESPLSQVVSVNILGGSGDLDAEFYYKPYDLTLINKNVVLPLSARDQKILNMITH